MQNCKKTILKKWLPFAGFALTAIISNSANANVWRAVVKGDMKAWSSSIASDPNGAGDPKEMRRIWKEYTTDAGESLITPTTTIKALPSPNYPLTSKTADVLIDGKLSSVDAIWSNQTAAGWTGTSGGTGPITLVIDLGSQQPIGRIGVRALGGRSQGALELPNSFEFLASNNGETFYSLHKMHRLLPAEAAQADGINQFYVPQKGIPYKSYFVFPFFCDTAIKARYVALRVDPQSSFFSDEIAVIKAPIDKQIQALNDANFPNKEKIVSDGVVVTPKTGSVVVTTNIATPNWYYVRNYSGMDGKTNNIQVALEMPDSLRIIPEAMQHFTEVASTKPNTRRYESKSLEWRYGTNQLRDVQGPVYLESTTPNPPQNASIRMIGRIAGKDSDALTYSVIFKKIPVVSPGIPLDNSFAFFLKNSVILEWPHMLDNYSKLGFKYVSVFPYMFSKQGDKWSPEAQQSLEFLKEARRRGYGVVDNESPFGIMWGKILRDDKAGKISKEEANQIFTQIEGKRGEWMNILYRGKYFQDEIQRIAEMTALVQTDHAYIDIEWWAESVNESKKDPRVIAAWKASGKSWDDFVTDVGTDVLGTLVKAMRKAVPDKKITVGLYASDPKQNVMDKIFQWDKIYPGIVDIAMPSLYVQGRAGIVAENVRFDYDAIKSRQIIPWLTGGTYGEFDPKLTEPMVLESILNGARGVTYYIFFDSDPMDFYYHAKALATLDTHRELLKVGRPMAFSGSNASLRYTYFASNNAAWLLVSNYDRSPQTKTSFAMPKGMKQVYLEGGKKLQRQNGKIMLEVPAGEWRLLYLSQ